MDYLKDVDTVRPAEDVLAGILEMAINDIQSLIMDGYIKDGRCTYTNENWPKNRFGTNQKVLGYYDKPHAITELIHFIKENEFVPILTLINARIEPKVISESVFNEDLVQKIVKKRRYRARAKV